MFTNLRLRAPGHERTYHSPFDWLCLMQHQRGCWLARKYPLRSYFSVKDVPDSDGELIVLNAKRLNNRSKRRRTISSADSGPVIIRAEMATARSLKKLRARESVRKAVAEDPVDLDCGWLETWLRPIAVLPRRLNERMVFESSVFTLHGGKVYGDDMRREYEGDLIPDPITLQQVDAEVDSKPILKRYRIPSGAKKDILNALFRLGIHEAMLFPEVDRQTAYLQRLWWYDRDGS